MKLSTQQLARLSRLLDEVVGADEAAVQRWLQALPPEQHDLEPALRRALARSGDDGDLLATLPKLALDALAGSALQGGDTIGPYRLLRRLGAGGMAEVWLAERADGAFRREVALKTPSHLPWRQDLSERFAVERDILAALEHPHIARFYDAGVGSDGRPYLALEYVPGRNLLQWADERRLGIRERIEIFLQVLQAVQYAHERGVLHRDLKPNNVLVTADGQVKLLDFGVARLMERPADADLTLLYGRALTPGYASPEHTSGERADAASDVYSLGVVLFELLSGRQPFKVVGGTVDTAHAAAPPSARLDVHAAALRGGSLARIARAVRGDLDAITRKALAPAAADRYDSAQALASDLRRHLAGEPVHAMPATLRYRTGKFAVRHRAVIAQAALAVLVVAGVVGWALQQGARVDARAPAATAAAPAATAAGDKSIAVLPFADLSEQHDQEHFADGLAEELIDRLARSPGLRVIARTSAFAFKGGNDDVRAVAAGLGVAYVLRGSVRRSGDTLRIAAQLVRVSDGQHLWSQTYERALADIFKVQDDIAGAVARSLDAVLGDRRAQGGAPVPNVEAYNLVLQGDVYMHGPFERDAQRAEVSFKKAAALDPGYALPWVRLGLLYMRQTYLSWLPKEQGNAQAREAIDKALQIEPHSIAAHAARFRYLVRVDFAWPEARAELDLMRTIDPRDPLLLPECEAIFAAIAGHLTEAIKIQGQIVARDPLNAAAIGTLASYLLQADRFDESLTLLGHELRLSPHGIGSHALIGVNLALLGRADEALAAIADERHKGYRVWAQAVAHALAGRERESDAALAELRQAPASNGYYIAQIYALRGKKAPAFEWLNRACPEHQSGCESLMIDRFLRELRSDPRYRALLVKLRLDGVN